MKQGIIALAVLALAALVATPGCAQDQEAPADAAASGLETQMQKVSYAIGQQIGGNFKQQGIDIDMDSLNQGMLDAMTGAESALTPEEMQQVMTSFQQEMAAKQQAMQQEAAEKNQKEGTAFLTENAKKEGVMTTDSGLQYKVLEEGSGDKPTAEDTVTVHYRGTLIDGTEFDSSHKRGQPATFPLANVIRGWTEGLQLMSPGAKYMFYIPSDLAYGPRGSGPTIGPNSTLIFEVELISVGAPEGGES